jgi:hypothetical protein
MDDKVYYLYAFTPSDCPVDGLGPAVDPRFRVELVSSGQLAALASRVGLDEFDLGRLAGQNAADVEWLSHVALRHNRVVSQAARLEQCRAVVTDFLKRLGDRQEWAAKIYIDQGHSVAPAAAANGKDYLLRKRQQEQDRRAAEDQGHREAATVEAALAGRADRACRVRLLPASLTGRREKMLLNAAYLVSRSASEPWLRLVERLGRVAAAKGQSLEVTGPWPPYHFCPEVNS